ncbi:hypothetical protein C8046_12020 [Serinibacter arcticus]|uniref:Uncharacterized protein n=1 Tax=Serinibacter arcticus TaxID=1655435 RepID=A0A2U1ZWA8_9MICO|nr:hypothetical protein [Serinibacter arcticus]PWD51275.1 hypothetical protein C8046_12020 [Serinibacter arcticus]
MTTRSARDAPPDPRTAGRLGRIALALAVASVVLVLVHRWMMGDGSDLPIGAVAQQFRGARPLVLLAFFATSITSLTLAAVSLSEAGRPRFASGTALVLTVGALIGFVVAI